MNLKELLKIKPEELAEKQLGLLKSQTISTLEKIINLIKKDCFNEVRPHLDSLEDEHSGEHKSSILFDFSNKEFENDILDVIERLEKLQTIINK